MPKTEFFTPKDPFIKFVNNGGRASRTVISSNGENGGTTKTWIGERKPGQLSVLSFLEEIDLTDLTPFVVGGYRGILEIEQNGEPPTKIRFEDGEIVGFKNHPALDDYF